MKPRLLVSLLFSLFFFVILVIANGLIAMLIPTSYNFHHTHWIIGRLTGLWGFDFLFDIGITSLLIGFSVVYLANRHFGYSHSRRSIY